jgi:uncharacterized membrane protein YeaQ/YmgE (transglycosylase-associated protein family)
VVYLIALITGLVLGFILSPNEYYPARGRRNYDFSVILTSIIGALIGVLFFVNFLGIRLTVGFLWLEAILWSLLGALILRLIVSAFSYDYEVPTEDRALFNQATAHEFRRRKSIKRRRRG